MTTTRDVLTELLETLRNRADTLRDMANENEDAEQSMRLKHKASGVALACSFVDDKIREL